MGYVQKAEIKEKSSKLVFKAKKAFNWWNNAAANGRHFRFGHYIINFTPPYIVIQFNLIYHVYAREYRRVLSSRAGSPYRPGRYPQTIPQRE